MKTYFVKQKFRLGGERFDIKVIGCICDFIAGNALYNFSIQPDGIKTETVASSLAMYPFSHIFRTTV